MRLTENDPHSSSRPDLVAVVHTKVELNVNVEQKVLKGTATLTVSQRSECDVLILDTHNLTIIRIENVKNGETLAYGMQNFDKFGDNLTIKLPPKSFTYTNGIPTFCEQKVQIVYETTPNSPALYWLTKDQNPTGKALLIANTKLTFARAIVPCQDTPSHRARFNMCIIVPEQYTVITSVARYRPFIHIDNVRTFAFHYTNVPSYQLAFIISIMKRLQSHRNNRNLCVILWTEEEYISKIDYMLYMLTNTMQNANAEYGIFSGRLTICVLPPNVPEFKVQCPKITFVSSTLFDRTFYSISTIVQNLSESWLGNLITLVNFEHLWLIKSFSTYISRKIVRGNLSEHDQALLKAGDVRNLLYMINLHGDTGVVCDLTDFLPYDVIESIPYEKGFLFLNELECLLGSQNFLIFLKNVLFNAARDFDNINWDYWLFENIGTNLFYVHQYSNMKVDCYNAAEALLTGRLTLDLTLSNIVTMLKNGTYVMKTEFLRYLYTSYAILSIDVLQTLKDAFLEDGIRSTNNEVWFLWLLLGIKSKWTDMAEPTLEFAYQNLTPKYVCAITRDLYKYPETREAALSWFCDKVQTSYILSETTEKLMDIILRHTPEDVQQAIEKELYKDITSGSRSGS